MTEAAIIFFSMTIIPVAFLYALYWILGRASAILNARSRRTVGRRLTTHGRK